MADLYEDEELGATACRQEAISQSLTAPDAVVSDTAPLSSQGEAPTAPAELAQPKTDGATGLQKSMRFLLQIIAGLLLSEFVIKSVTIVDLSPATANIVILASAGVFLFRIFIDNLLFYEASDKPIRYVGEYICRIALLLLDLASYVVCYDIMYRLGKLAAFNKAVYLPKAVVRLLLSIALVELLHLVWALGAWAADRRWNHGNHKALFSRWALASLITVVAMAALAHDLSNADTSRNAANRVAAGSIGSAVLYLVIMNKQYREKVG